MRPVLLEVTGFGSFREPTTVDLRDADFFALTGPTGAGKSTVIDAMTFALYGSVPRWDDRRTVSLALAPTLNRGFVRLVFDVGSDRYVVARELRRTQSSVGIRNGRLERLIDPTSMGSTEDETEPIAADSRVNEAVEKLLGLSFDHFCACVVLPQGDFAEFLHAKPRDRQEILTRLLGIGLYKTIAQQANIEAAEAKQRAGLFAEQIAQLADVTTEAEAEATQRVQQLSGVRDHVAAILPELSAATAAVEEARHDIDQIQDEQARLSGLTAPSGLAERAGTLTEAARAATEAGERYTAADGADVAAQRAFDTAASARRSLEQARRNYDERAMLEQQLPDAEAARAKAAEALSAVTVERKTAVLELSAARKAADAAATCADAARERVETLRAEQARLLELTVPAGITEIHEHEQATKAALAAAEARLKEAEEAEENVRHQIDGAPARAILDRAKHHHSELVKVLTLEPGLTSAVDHTRAEIADRRTALDEAIRALDKARLTRDEAVRVHAVAALRPHLVAGQPCPVCEHPVEGMPEALVHDTLTAAEEAFVTAERRRESASLQYTEAMGQEQKAVGALLSANASTAELRQALAGEWADENVLDAELGRLDALSAALRTTGTELRETRAEHKAADKTMAALAKKHASARTALNSARDPLVSLGAPAVDSLDLADAWTALTTWCRQEAGMRSERLENAEAEADEAEAASTAAGESLARAEGLIERLDAGRVAAARTDQETDMALRQVNHRLTELADALAAASSSAYVAAELARIDQLESDAKTAHERLRAARTARDAAAEVLSALRIGEQAAWNDLRTARDRLVPLGAPPVREGDLQDAWTELVSWADRQTNMRHPTLATAHAALSTAERHRSETTLALSEALERAGIDVPDQKPIAEAASAAVATELERARAHVQRTQSQLAQLADLRARLAISDEDYNVAHMLGGLLRSSEFPQWLVAEALDVLVQDASASLAKLSGGQFDLAHEDGEFVVIDHNNADLRRPVKTLSGGETFQASLALALALSAQITTLAAAGSVRLDSIFLDEGFGTLDEATLETVAGTLENLASQGNRMVGIVSHVSALTDRIPVRFRVNRDQFGSTVTRDNP